MSKYYKAEDVEREIGRLLQVKDDNDFGFGVKYGIETLERLLKDTPTIEVSEDAISREAVMDIVCLDPGITSWQHKMLKELPSVVPQPKEGEWISKHNGYWTCSECGLSFLFYAKGNYCPNCGCRMKGADDE